MGWEKTAKELLPKERGMGYEIKKCTQGTKSYAVKYNLGRTIMFVYVMIEQKAKQICGIMYMYPSYYTLGAYAVEHYISESYIDMTQNYANSSIRKEREEHRKKVMAVKARKDSITAAKKEIAAVEKARQDSIAAAPKTVEKVNTIVYTVVDEMPSFPGGEKALMQFLKDNVHYPEEAAEHKIQGRVVVHFVVSADGTINDVKIKDSVDPSIDKEAIRVVKSMPKWKPGRANGKYVNVHYSMPLTFRLQ